MKQLAPLLLIAFLALAVAVGRDAGRVLAGPDPAIIPGRYIVTLDSRVPDATASAASLTRSHGGSLHYVYQHALRGFAASLSSEAAAALGRNPDVVAVVPDGIATIIDTQSPTPSWGLDRIDQRSLPLNGTYGYASTGLGVRAYIIDTGIRTTHQDFGGRAIDGYDAVDGALPADDCHGHGTHVAGTVGGSAYGVAKGVTLVAVRVLNCSGSGTWSGVIAGIDWVTGDAAGRIAVVNMSLGGGANSAVDAAVSNSIASGVTFAIAAGNSNANACNYSPARVGAALTVGATSSTDGEASFSNYGTCVDLLAPGVSITSAWRTSNSATNTISGTSMAAPHVAGAAARYLQANPSASPAAVAAGITEAATTGAIALKAASRNAGTPNLLLYVGAATPTKTAPGAPLLSATAGNSVVNLSWTTPPDGGDAITGYRVYRAAPGESPTLLAPLGVVNAFDDLAVESGVTYSYWVSAVNGEGEGDLSSPASATPSDQSTTAPAAPSSLVASPSNGRGVDLRWSPPGTDGGAALAGYRVYRSTSSGGPKTLITTTSNTSYKDTGTARGATYCYVVTAMNAVGESEPSNEACSTAK